MRTRATLLLALAWLVVCPGPGFPQVVVVPPPTPPTAEGLETQGAVRRVERTERRVTLDTGEEYIIPPTLDTAWSVLREGSEVRLRYDVDGGRNVVRSVTIIR